MIRAEENMGLALSIAKRYFHRGEADDIKQMAYEGLMLACNRFDETRDVKFSTYATFYIEGAIRRGLMNGYFDTIRRTKDRQLRSVIAKELKGEKDLSFEEIANKLNLDVSKVERALTIETSVLSLDVEIEEGIPFSETFSTNDDHLEFYLNDLMKNLDDMERYVLESRYKDNMSQREIGERFGVSQVHISRIEKRALKKLRKQLEIA